jgi:hypothetical protein
VGEGQYLSLVAAKEGAPDVNPIGHIGRGYATEPQKGLALQHIREYILPHIVLVVP